MLLALLKTLTKKRKIHSPICFSQKFISSSASHLGQIPVPQKLDFRRGKRTHRRHGPKFQRLKHRARFGLGRGVAAETWVGCAGPRIASLQRGDAAPPHWGRAHKGAACSDFFFYFFSLQGPQFLCICRGQCQPLCTSAWPSPSLPLRRGLLAPADL